MEINIPIEQLQKRGLMVCTPMYGGQCAGMFTKSCNDLSALCMHYKIPLKFYYLFNESLVTRARNYCCDEFMRSDSTHMIFIDSDISFNPNDVITMLAMMDHEDEDNKYDILCAPYPKKCISWEKIKQAVDMGAADDDPNVLENFVGDYVFNPANGKNTIKLDKPQEVLEGGTGFMMIRREVFEKFQEQYPQMLYKPDHVRTKEFDGSREIMAYFDALIDDKSQNLVPEITAFYDNNPNPTKEEVIEFLANKREGIERETYSNRYLSEDYMFCQWVRNMGMSVWLCPWMKLQHVGSYIFGGSLADLAAVGATATADQSQVKRK